MTWLAVHSALVLILSTLLVGAGAAGAGGASAAAGTNLQPVGLLLAAQASVAFLWLIARAGVGARGPANLVTGLRLLVAIGILAALSFSVLTTEWAAVLFAAAILGELSDFADGQIARRAGTPTAFGATFDMETDALFVLALSLAAVRFYGLPWWVSVAGLIRYAAAVPFMLLPEPVFPRSFTTFAKSACAVSVLLLVATIFPAGVATFTLSPQLRLTAGTAAVALLGTSFAAEAFLRFRARRMRPPRAPGAWRGLFRSILVYHAVPLRHFSIRRFYQSFISEGELAFDIGAHVGNRVAALRSLGARVIAVEPQPSCLTLLRRLFASDPGVALVDAACGAEPSTSRLYVSSAHPTLSTLSTDWTESIDEHFRESGVEWDRQVEVTTTTLDALIDQFGEPAFIKVDVEGFEPAVLAGLSKPVRAISVEFLPAAVEGAIESLHKIEALGSYRYNYSMVETMRFASATWLTAAELEQILRAMPRTGASGDIYAVRAQA